MEAETLNSVSSTNSEYGTGNQQVLGSNISTSDDVCLLNMVQHMEDHIVELTTLNFVSVFCPLCDEHYTNRELL